MRKGKYQGRARRHRHLRRKVRGTAQRPRMVVFRSNRHIYAQVVDDDQGRVMTGTSSLSPAFKKKKVKGDKKKEAAEVGKLLATKLKEQEVKRIVFDRAGYRYHGRVRALAEAARKEGLEF